MRIYVASSWRNERQPSVVRALREAGHEVYDFRHPHMGPGQRGVGFSWSTVDPDWRRWDAAAFRESLDHPRAVEGFEADFAGMNWADAFVLVNPSGRSAHLELGWATGAGKPAFILLEEGDEPELMYRLATRLCIGVASVLDALDQAEIDATVDSDPVKAA